MDLYAAIGETFIREAITEFYRRAFADPIIGHLFINHDRDHITKQQIAFSISMLGGPKMYTGKSLRDAHKDLPLKLTHFRRRQVLMREVVDDLKLPETLATQWLAREEQLRPLIITDPSPCNR